MRSVYMAAVVLSIVSSAHGQVAYSSFGSETSLRDTSSYYFPITYSVGSKLGWRFTPSVSGGVTQLDAVIKYTSTTPLNVRFEIFGDTGGLPDLLLGSMTRTITRNNTGFTIPVTTFTSNGSISLTAGQTYYAVLSRDSLAVIQWINQVGAADGVQMTQGDFNGANPPGVWEDSSITLPNVHFPTSSFRISVPTPGAAAFWGIGAIAVAARRRRAPR